MARTFSTFVAASVALATAVVGSIVMAAAPAAAASSDVVINEMMTKAGPATDPAFEFIELYNRGVDPVDVSGWGFSAGIALDPTLYPLNAAGTLRVLPAGTVIPAHSYFVGSSNPGVFSTVTGSSADFSFAPSGLSSSGETVTLVDGAGATVDTVTYAAAAPWPSSPNGTGPSLELVDPFLDNTLAASWGASTGDNGTPKAKNSIYGAPPPTLTDVVTSPLRPDPGQSVTVQAKMPLGAPATLTYKVMFGSDVVIPFLDNAASVGGADDGTYSAVVPGTTAGTLVRFRIDASVGGASVSWPAAGDSRGYDGFVVKDPSLSTAQLPVMEWFLDDASYAGLLRTVCDNVEYVGVITWQGKVFDNSTLPPPGPELVQRPEAEDRHGSSRRVLHRLQPLRGCERRTVHRPARRVGAAERGLPRPRPRLGERPPGGRPAARLHAGPQSSATATFFGVGAVLEKYDGTWRKTNGLRRRLVLQGRRRRLAHLRDRGRARDLARLRQEGPRRRGLHRRLAVHAGAEPVGLRRRRPPGSTPTSTCPEVVNFMAITVELRHWDSGGKNFYIFRDASAHRSLEGPALGPRRHLLRRLRHQG